MTRIDKIWWDHLAPNTLLPVRGEVQSLLMRQEKNGGGAEWLKVARQPGGVFRVRPGQSIPVFHVLFMKGLPPFIGPPPKLRAGHRTVNHATPLRGGPLAHDELVIEPVIRVEWVDDPFLLEAARRGQTKIDEAQVTSPSVIFTCPARLLLTPKHHPQRAFVLYQHIFGAGSSYPDDGFFYVGITTRTWQKRWAEHRRAIQTGSRLLFHHRFREELAAGRISYVHHRVMMVTDDLESLYAEEEFLVGGHWDDARRLNMVPGGKSGLSYMRENGMLPDRVIPMPDERDRIIAKWLEEHPRKGLPAPWVAEKWRDNDWAVAQICGRDGRLTVEQVRAIRILAKEHDSAEIAVRIGARNEAQVRRVIEGKTYTRVKQT